MIQNTARLLQPTSIPKVRVVVVTLAAVGAAFVSAPVEAQDFSSGYQTEETLPAGMMVSLVDEEAETVEPTNSANMEDLLGVVVSGSNSIFQITSGESNAQVVTSGFSEVLVTDVNGEVVDGDYITASEINGIGMRADEEHAHVLGQAQGDVRDSATRTVETEAGDTREVTVGRVPVIIKVGANPKMTDQETPLPGFIQGAANELAGEPVAPVRIMIALVIITGGLVGSTVLLYGAVSSTIIAIGRNPLSNKSVYAGLVRMISISMAIILFSVALGYVVVAAG